VLISKLLSLIRSQREPKTMKYQDFKISKYVKYLWIAKMPFVVCLLYKFKHHCSIRRSVKINWPAQWP